MYHFLFPYGKPVWKEIKKTEFIMIAILTDKPSVGKEIGRIIGATKVKNGYVEGNGYMVTWTFGNMLSLAMPKDYGIQRLERDDFPFIPSEFGLMVRHIRTNNGWIPDIDAVLQLKVIEKVFQNCDTIIAATDASRDGEMTFRYVYQYLNCTQPCFRLWISSLTDESVRKGMEELKPDSFYDSLFLAADSRNKADWILGVNACYAMCKATGLGNNSLGRVQTPVLAAICRRYRERENHISSDSWPIYISLQKEGILFKMRRTQDILNKESAVMFFQDCKLAQKAQITNVSHSIREVLSPELLDLTQLQKEASIRYGLTAPEVYDIAQSLYEKKLISYPRTSSRYLTEDVFDSLPPIMTRLLSWELFPVSEKTSSIDIYTLPRHVINAKKVNVHHAIIITGIHPGNLSEKEMLVYRLIAGRMLEAFMPPCRIETTSAEAICAAQKFKAEHTRVIEAGWHDVFMRSDTVSQSGFSVNELPWLDKGDTLKVCGCNLVHKKQLPVSPFMDAELVEYMEQNGLGTVSSRTNIIRTLINRKYIRYSGKYIIPTPKGMFTYETIRGKKIADTSLTTDWEKQFAELENGMTTGQEFLDRIKVLAKEMTDDIFNTYSQRKE